MCKIMACRTLTPMKPTSSGCVNRWAGEGEEAWCPCVSLSVRLSVLRGHQLPDRVWNLEGLGRG